MLVVVLFHNFFFHKPHIGPGRIHIQTGKGKLTILTWTLNSSTYIYHLNMISCLSTTNRSVVSRQRMWSLQHQNIDLQIWQNCELIYGPRYEKKHCIFLCLSMPPPHGKSTVKGVEEGSDLGSSVGLPLLPGTNLTCVSGKARGHKQKSPEYVKSISHI